MQGLTLESREPMKVARQLVGGLWTDEKGGRMLYEHEGSFYEWDGKVWCVRTVAEVEDGLWTMLEDAKEIVSEKEGVQVAERFHPDINKVRNVRRALEAITRGEFEAIPTWLGGGGDKPDIGHVIAFKNCLVDVRASAAKLRETGKMEYVVVERGREFFSPCVAPVEFKEKALCPTWESCMEEWGAGDEKWTELRERMYGYALMGTRKYAKWLLEYGKVRGGKGSGTRVLKRLLPHPMFFGVKMEELADGFGLDGVDVCSVLCISEASDLDNRTGERVSSLLKSVLGEDTLTVNAKYLRQKKDVVIRALPIVQSNQMLTLPNTARGLSSKMVALGFENSFEGREDFELGRKLDGELAGIARRFVDAAIRLEAEEDPRKKFEMPGSSQDVIRKFDRESNLFDAFLDDCFVKNRGGWVHNDKVRELRRWWEKENGYTIRDNRRAQVSQMHFPKKLCELSSWGVSQTRGEEKRGVKGLSVRRELVR